MNRNFIILILMLHAIGRCTDIVSLIQEWESKDWKNPEIVWITTGNRWESHDELFMVLDADTGEALTPEISVSYQIEELCFCGDPMWSVLESLQYTLWPPVDHSVDLSNYVRADIEIPYQIK